MSPRQYVGAILNRITRMGAGGGFGREIIQCDRATLALLEELGVRYTIRRGNGPCKVRTVWHYEDKHIPAQIVRKAVERLGMIYSRPSISADPLADIARVRPAFALFDVDNPGGERGDMLAREAVERDPAMVVALYSAREDLPEISGELPYLSKNAGPVALRPWLEQLFTRRADVVELAVPSRDLELLRIVADGGEEGLDIAAEMA